MNADTIDESLTEGFGCAQCWPASAQQVVAARAGFETQHRLIDEGEDVQERTIEAIGELRYVVRLYKGEYGWTRGISVGPHD